MNNIPSQSALQAFGIKQSVNANNIANMNTPGFDSKRATLEEVQNNQGVRVQDIQKRNQNLQSTQGGENNLQNSGQNSIQISDTDLGREMVGMIENESAYKANATAIRVNQQMTGTLLNVTS